jgi:nitric oxide dioxygenase
MNLNIDALEASFDQVAVRGDELVETFYERLFTVAPAVRPLFAGTDLKRQKAMLLATLVLLRRSLRDLESVTPKLRELGARHVRYGALPEHYPVVGEVLIASMAEIAGDAWTLEYELAWTEAFAVVSAAMLDGASSVASVA